MKKLFYLIALVGCVAVFTACNKDSGSGSSVPEKLAGTRWITSEGEGDNRTVVMLEFLDGVNAQYTKKAGTISGTITPRSDRPSGDNVTYNYKYTYSKPDVVLKPISIDAPSLSGKILGGHGSMYSYISLSTADGELFFTAFQDDGSYIWDL